MTIRDSVSAVFTCAGEVFMILRQPYLPAFPCYYAFPGGKVDRDELDSTYSAAHLSTKPARLMRALVRELNEELDYDLEAACSAGEVIAVEEVCSATTPIFEHYRFCNRFYRIDLHKKPDFHPNAEEIQEAIWARPADLLQAWYDARALMVPPLRVMLRSLAEDPFRTPIPDVEFLYDAERYVPIMEVMPELWQIPVRSHTLPPADRTNAMIIGAYLLDPSPADQAELERLKHTLAFFCSQNGPLTGVFLTHHHPDHHQFANELARSLGLPIHLSRDTKTRIERRQGADYFNGIQVKYQAEGDVLTHWRDQEVLVHEVPGHDQGQLALAPRNLAWFFVGDLIQGIGTVVISAPEGHMGQYFKTLERVIALDPKVIIPSHGIAMGSTYRLQATLAHRRERELEVLRLHGEGLAKRQILDTIYQGLDERLRPLAMANIEAHLTKLREEGLIT